MKCANCKQPADALIRVNELGEDGIFWCEHCVRREEPELYRNHIEENGRLINAILNRSQK